jgi:hypothetical protein
MFKMKKSVAAIAAVLAGSPLLASAVTGPSSSAAPYLQSVAAGWDVKSILTTGDSVGGYKMGGIPDGLGAFDNNDGSFSVVMNQEWGAGLGVAHDVLAPGAYVSKWVINKSDLSVVSGGNLIQQIATWNTATQSSNPLISTAAAVAFNRFCSSDLPSLSGLSYTDTATNTTYGTTERLFLNGEEGGANGRALATVVTGANAGNAYELGKFNPSTNGSGITAVGGWENILINPFSQLKTVAIGNNDGGTGVLNNALEVYIGTKTTSGSEVDKAGLTNGVAKFINVDGITAEIANTTTRATNIVDGAHFSLSDTASTTFSRPEDGAWSADGSKYFFVTTDQLDKTEITGQTQIGRSRLWELDFADIANPELGGTVKVLLDGTEGQNMLDNMTVSADGKSLMLQEDTGNAPHNASIWSYDLTTSSLTKIFKHDSTLFGDVVNGVAVAGSITADEESSGVIDISEILGYKAYLLTTQNHAGSSDPYQVEGGQLQVVTAPAAVPVPGAVWLFGSAILGFFGVSRRQKA